MIYFIMITDEIIIKMFYGKRQIYAGMLKKLNTGKLSNDIIEYLDSRFNDSSSYKETLYRIKYGIEARPVCKMCGGKVDFIGKKDKGFNEHCSCKCTQQDSDVRKKNEETCMVLYGVSNPAKSEKIKEQIKNTNLQRYGVENVYKSELIKERIKHTMLERYGVENIHNAPYIVKRWKENEQEIVKKRNATKKLNKSFNTSSPEEYCYEFLSSLFNDVYRQYQTDVYPYACDFYIKDLDMYVELNCHWTHGSHPFDDTDEQDLAKVQYWKSKNTKFYNIAIDVWTRRDVIKRQCAKQSGIKFLEFWKKEDLIDYFNKNYNI